MLTVPTNREPPHRQRWWPYPLLVSLTLAYLLVIGPTHLAEVGYRLPIALAVVCVGTWRSAQGSWVRLGHLDRQARRYQASSLLCAWFAHVWFAAFLVLWQAGVVPFVGTGLCLAGAVVLAECARLPSQARHVSRKD
jgi:hypothetical protein